MKLSGKNEILVIEIKKDDDDNYKNRAKYRDGTKHFDTLNQRLLKKGFDWQYHFYFLSEENYPDFFQVIRECRYAEWKSALMAQLES